MEDEKNPLEISSGNQEISGIEIKKTKGIPGVLPYTPKVRSDEEVQALIEKQHEDLFSHNQTPEGGRHGRTRPLDLSEFFEDFSLS